MNNRVIAILRSNEKRVSNQITKLREKLWYEEDINSIRKKLQQCDITPLSKEEKKERYELLRSRLREYCLYGADG